MNVRRFLMPVLGAALLLAGAAGLALARDQHAHAANCDQADKCQHEISPAAAGAKVVKGKRVEITVTEKGFEPNKIEVKKGEAVTLAFTRKTERTCAKEVILDTGDQKIEKKLPMNETVVITAKFKKTGDLTYACGMNMITGVLAVR